MTIETLHWTLTAVLTASNFFLWVELKAMQKSTHQVQFVNAKGDFEQVTKELQEKFSPEHLYENLS